MAIMSGEDPSPMLVLVARLSFLLAIGGLGLDVAAAALEVAGILGGQAEAMDSIVEATNCLFGSIERSAEENNSEGDKEDDDDVRPANCSPSNSTRKWRQNQSIALRKNPCIELPNKT